jgi:two-component system, LytTR family, response regulator LytT
MNQLKIGIIENDFLIAESIAINLKQIGYLPTKPARSYDEALKLIETEKPDLLLVDITLDGEKDGIDVAATVSRNYGIPFIFLTAYSDAATVNRAKETHPLAYLVKPFTENDLFSSIEVAFNNYNNQQKKPFLQNATSGYLNNIVFIKQGELYHKLEIEDIIFVESDNVYLNIYTASDKHFIVRNKLDDFIAEISNHDFIKVHRSYAVNIKHLDAVNNINIKVAGKDIPVSKEYRQALLQRIKHFK